jgi:hypothetical protein
LYDYKFKELIGNHAAVVCLMSQRRGEPLLADDNFDKLGWQRLLQARPVQP